MGVVYQTMLNDCQFLVIFASPITHVFHTNTRTGACEGHTDKLFPVRKSLGEWVGIDRKYMKKAKNMQQFFQIEVRIPLG